MSRHRAATSSALAVMLALALPLGSTSVDARAGGGSSFGSRGSRTFSTPAPTATAPRAAQPMQRTETPAPNPGTPGFGNPGLGSAAQQPRRFGFGTGLSAGLLGAGLFGMLTGGGFFGGLGGLASMLGLLLQVALIGGLIVLAMRFFRSRGARPAFAGIGPSTSQRSSGGLGGGLGSVGAIGGGASSAAAPAPAIGPREFTAFERAMGEIQTAFGREDLGALSRLTTAEMLRHFGSQIEQNRAQGLRNDIADPELLQGDLAEAWRDGGADYATVAMRFAVRDTMVERASGRIVSGDAGRPSEATELWTFRREGGGPWLLAAIQQAG